MVAHHAYGGCNLRSGDLMGSGTISSAVSQSSFLESAGDFGFQFGCTDLLISTLRNLFYQKCLGLIYSLSNYVCKGTLLDQLICIFARMGI